MYVYMYTVYVFVQWTYTYKLVGQGKLGKWQTAVLSWLALISTVNTAKNFIPIRGRKRARYGTELQYRYVQLRQSHCIFFVWGLPYSSNRHVTPVSVRGRKGLTCLIRAPPCPRFDTLRQSVSNGAQLFLAVYALAALVTPV